MAKKSKILFIMHMPPPVHGASMVGESIRQSSLINDSFDAQYVNLSTANSIEDIGKFRVGKIWDYLCLLFRTWIRVMTFRPQLVYITPNAKGGPFYKDFVMVQMLKGMGCRVVAQYHNKGVSTRQDRIIDNWLYQRFFKNIWVILLSEVLFQDMKKYVSRDHVLICPNGIRDAYNDVVPKRNNNIPQLLFLSNLIKEKGVFDLLDACQILQDKGVDFGCTFVGAESDEISKQVFEQEVRNRGLEASVQYVGKKYGSEKEACYVSSDIFVFPTYYHNECFPLVLLEAMSYGLPCVSTDEGAVCEIIDDTVTGYVVEKNDTRQLADKLELLVKDAQLRRNMGCAGRDKFKKCYTQQEFGKRLYRILHSIVSSC